MEVLPLRPLHLAARQHQSGAARKQTGGVAKKTRVATAVAKIATAAGTPIREAGEVTVARSAVVAETLIKAAGEATVVKISAGAVQRPAGRASETTAVPRGTAAEVVASRAVGLLVLRVDVTNRQGRIAAEAHPPHAAKKSRRTATAAETEGTTGVADPAMRGCNSY